LCGGDRTGSLETTKGAIMSTPDTHVGTPAHQSPAEGRRHLRFTWIFVALLPVTFVAAMFLGEFLLSLQGYESGSEVRPPLGVVLLAGVPAVLVLISPTIPATWFGFRARRLGVSGGTIPAVIGAVALVFGLATNFLPMLLGR
jgi:hypothetical protein